MIIAMGLAGLVNASMLITAAAVFHTRGLDELGDDLEGVHAGLGDYLGAHARAPSSASRCSRRASRRRASARWPARS